jgi:hypothetical protein
MFHGSKVRTLAAITSIALCQIPTETSSCYGDTTLGVLCTSCTFIADRIDVVNFYG